MSGFHQTLFGEVPEAKAGAWNLVENYFSPLKPLYQNPEVTEILVDRFDNISIERNGILEKTEIRFESENALQWLITQVSKCLEQPIDADHPVMDARLPDCSRLCCTLPAVSPQGATITLRVVPRQSITAEQLVELGAMTGEMLAFLSEKVRQGANMVVSGNTGSGKTTLLRALAHFIPKRERVVTCEDTQELYLNWFPSHISLEAPKRKNSTFAMKDLIETSLRQRPDRIWVGEIRHSAAADAFLQAINTGHSAVTTIHANSCEDAKARLQYLIATAGFISYELAEKQILGSVNVFIHAHRHPDYGRKITGISLVENEMMQEVFWYNTLTEKHGKRIKE